MPLLDLTGDDDELPPPRAPYAGPDGPARSAGNGTHTPADGLTPVTSRPPDDSWRPRRPRLTRRPPPPPRRSATTTEWAARRVSLAQGRAAPGLYLVGWLGSVLGLAILFAVILAAPGGTSALVLLLIATFLLAVGLVAAAGAQGMQRRASGNSYSGPSPILVFIASLPISLPVAILVVGLGVPPASTRQGPLAASSDRPRWSWGSWCWSACSWLAGAPCRGATWASGGPGCPHALADLAFGAVLALPIICFQILRGEP